MAPDWLTARPIAHRGLHDYDAGIVENTIPAVEAAIAHGFAIEVDLQLTRDGEAVVFHDFRLDRLTDRTGRLVEHDASDLAEIPFRRGDGRIVRLTRLLDVVAGRVPLFLEIKSAWKRERDQPLVERVCDLVSGYDGPVAIMSFDPEMVAATRRIAPGVVRGIVADETRDRKQWGRLSTVERFSLRHILHAPRTRPQFIAYCVDDLPMRGPAIMRSAFGLPILAWTVRTIEQQARAAMFADQMIFEGFVPDA